ncbi:MAG: lipoyl(octanoyl) transferase LipB [Gammaproteobacteria bacterium]|nr:lipoyl(octanoyl) transferase LipB [Gammaproteobacteria bacterium]
MKKNELIIRDLGLRDYIPVWKEMQEFTVARDDTTPDEVWLLQHTPVFTQGLNGKAVNVIDPGDIPVVQVDRGGQVTYHGPGQIVAYILVDLNRRGWGVRHLVTAIENTVIGLLNEYSLEAYAKPAAPGVYVSLNQQDAKIASLGLRVKRGRSYHGVSLNIELDLEPFECINPCGYKGLKVTQLSDLVEYESLEKVGMRLLSQLKQQLGYEGALMA